jgi:carboxyl-terminal processing protease
VTPVDALRLVLGAGLLALAGQAAPPADVGVAAFDTAWRLVRDTHFDPTFGGVDWDRVRDELRPRAVAARTPDELRAVIQQMLDRLGHSHFALIPAGAAAVPDAAPGADPDGGEPGFDVRLIEEDGGAGAVVVTRVVPESPAAAAGIRPGWIVERIGGESVAPIVARLSAVLDPRRRRVEVWRAVTTRLRGRPGSDVSVTFVDEHGTSLERTVARREAPGERVTVGYLPTFAVQVERAWLSGPRGVEVGLVRFNVWMTPVDRLVGAAVREFQDAHGIVLDLRGNPGGLAAMLMGMSGYFLDAPVALGTVRTRSGELRLVANPRRVDAAGARLRPYAGPLAILVDALTGSASECFAAGLQALGRARVFGEPSMGQALPALFDRLPNGDVLIHAYGDFVTPQGARVEGRGVQPDELVPTRREDLLAGRDAALGAAVSWIARVAGRAGSVARMRAALIDWGDPRLAFLSSPRSELRGTF